MNFDTLSQQTRTTGGGSSSSQEEFVLDLPQAHFKPLKVGILQRRTKLDEILEKLHLPHEDFIFYTDVNKVNDYQYNTLQVSKKSRDLKPYLLVLATDCFYTIGIKKNNKKSYQYFDIESLRPWITPQFQHGFKLRYYRKDGNLKNPQMEQSFICKDAESYFSVTHVIQRQMPHKWQEFFEKSIQIQADDCY